MADCEYLFSVHGLFLFFGVIRRSVAGWVLWLIPAGFFEAVVFGGAGLVTGGETRKLLGGRIMVRQSQHLGIMSQGNLEFVAHATATADGVQIVVCEEFDDGGFVEDWALFQARMLSEEVFEKFFTWEEFIAAKSIQGAGVILLADNGIRQWV